MRPAPEQPAPLDLYKLSITYSAPPPCAVVRDLLGYPTMSSQIPTRFRFSFHDAWQFPHFRAEWLPEKQRLQITRRPYGTDAEEIEVSEARWKAFWRKLEALGAWEWPADHEACQGDIAHYILDGHGWDLEIELGGRVLKTGGSNAYPAGPDDFDNTDSTPLFRRLLRAAKALGAKKR